MRVTLSLAGNNDNNNNDEEVNIADKKKKNKGFFNFDLFNIYESEIPDEIRDEIYAAEAKTPAAKERGVRIALYAFVAVLGILLAFFNVFVSELKAGLDPEMPSMEEAGFAWVAMNPIASFFFLNKIGGLILLLVGGGSGLLAEAEFDTRRINAERIFLEIKRRKELKDEKQSAIDRKNSNKKRKSGSKESKRIIALSEVIDTSSASEKQPERDVVTSNVVANSLQEDAPAVKVNDDNDSKNEKKIPGSGGIIDTVKSFYQRADAMAASQALLLNKKLEEQGLLEKITDESGLRVIGKDEAAKLMPKTTTTPTQPEVPVQQQEQPSNSKDQGGNSR